MAFRCDIVTQERTVFNGEVKSVSLPGSEGRMGILPNHSPLLTTLGFGEVIVRDAAGGEQYFAIGGGFAEVQPDHLIVLADSAEQAEEIDIERAEQARARAEQAMKEGVAKEDPDKYAQIQASLLRAQVRLDVGRKHSGRQRREMATGFSQPRDEDRS
ncbi:MAG: F0F1 ATP synthase subunit epsilon [Chloroflexi bacterium]|nr:F0F1 ATP synthase subunit epsilon [Ardenticatenaceae bacterium]MBL1127066.1 F0F1 ATP synthase subunit epsilon [Chloroflexota bacterium]NOG33128.1 F0F1 ATP synthase subunit epsilon [Chloroflexota bacterium]GIK54922.1 MAG: ATP synthase epsilon chain [Chloroflexota bacterium]